MRMSERGGTTRRAGVLRAAVVRATAGLAMGLLAGCDRAFDCTLVETYPLEVTPVDAVTGAGIADSAVATATRSGQTWRFAAYRADGSGRITTLWGGSGAGTYAIRVEHPRYQSWDTAGVVVLAAEGCARFVPVQLVARLAQRAGAGPSMR